MELADNPLIYARPDTTSFYVGKCKISVSVYSATNKIKSQKIAEILKPTIYAIDKFFNGLPVDSYQFLYYFEDPAKGLTDREKGGGGYGALEHNHSSLYYLPETSFVNELKSMVLDVSTHEFLHILTPLHLHSAEVANFDFSSPKMSQHLWLYEGVTEYFAQLVQFQNGLIDEKKFIKAMQEKIDQAKEYGDFSMTEMSKRVMEPDFQKKYNSVYNRGALLAFMLDLEIREKTSGAKDLKTVVQALAKKYDSETAFNDDEFFKEFVNASHPDIEKFLNSYIKGDRPMPLAEYFRKIGYNCLPFKRVEGYYAGVLNKKFDQTLNATVFTGVGKNLLGIENNDVLVKVQDIDVTADNVEDLWDSYFDLNQNAPELYVTVRRKGVEIPLSAKLYGAYYNALNYLELVSPRTPEQEKNLKQLLN